MSKAEMSFRKVFSSTIKIDIFGIDFSLIRKLWMLFFWQQVGLNEQQLFHI